jgi:hypothetical protein
MRRTPLALACSFIACLLTASTAAAQDVSDMGHAVYVPTDLTKVELPDGTYAVEQSTQGYVLTDDRDSAFNRVAQDCTGTNIVAADGSPILASGYCSGRDTDGDMYWFSYWNGADRREWTLVGGTGKFEGISGGGTSEMVSMDAGGTFLVRWEGSWSTP